MRVYKGSIKQGATTDAYFDSIGLKYPEVRKKVISRFCEEKGSALIADMLGTGRTITPKQLADSKKMFTTSNTLNWYVESRHRRLVTFKTVTPIVGTGANNASVTITLSGADGYLKAGVVIRIVNKATGTAYLLLLTSAATVAGANFTYTAKLVASDVATAIPGGIVVADDQAGWSFVLNSADCSNDQFTDVPVTFPDLFKNYTSTLRIKKDVCKSGIQTNLWIEGDNGSKCYMPEEERQFYYDVFKSLSNAAIYGQSSYAANGTIINTDQNGLSVGAGDGLLAQVDASSVINWQVSTYYNTPANYETLRLFLQNQIVAWGLREGINGGLLNLYTGKAGKMLLQSVLHDYAVTGKCCTMTDFSEDGEQVQKVLDNITHYAFAGYEIVIREEVMFNDVTQHPPVSALGNASLEAFRMVLIPDKSCDGEPIAQMYFKGGCKVEDSLKPSVRPGTINPYATGGQGNINVTGRPGYELLIETEFTVVLNNPYGVLHLNPFV